MLRLRFGLLELKAHEIRPLPHGMLGCVLSRQLTVVNPINSSIVVYVCEFDEEWVYAEGRFVAV